MATPSKQIRRTLDDSEPIVFPEPVGPVKAETEPNPCGPNSDVIVDPYGNYYCFVCRVSVPRGLSNVSAHLDGKKHETNGKRFPSAQQKLIIRDRYINAATLQRANSCPASTPGDKPAIKTNATSAPPISAAALPAPSVGEDSRLGSSSASNLGSAAPEPGGVPSSSNKAVSLFAMGPSKGIEKPKRAKRREQAKKIKTICIDKEAYVAELLAADDSDDNLDSSSEDSVVRAPSRALADDAKKLNQRPKSFEPWVFKPDESTVSFFDSVAAETEPTGNGLNLRHILSTSPVAKQKGSVASKVANSGTEDDAMANAAMSGTSGGTEDTQEYIKLVDESRQSEEKGEQEETEESQQLVRQSMCILKDTNGEELPPWLLHAGPTENVLYTGDSSISLHYEILEFAKFMSPTEAELSSRNEMIVMVKSIVKQLWPESTAQVFGSYATGLYLPSSDVDICVMGTPASGELKEFEQLAEAVRNVGGFARRVNVLSSAKVPLVKIIARKTSMNCDICIGRENGPRNVPVIKKYLESFPALRPLLLVVKCFLKQRDLNEVFSGGLGSYTIFLLVVSHLQMLRYNFPSMKANLGAVLQTFFQFYGRMFNLCISGIRVKEDGSYFDKFDKYETPPHETMRFSVEDPNDESNELGRNGYGATRVRKAFSNASLTLINWRRDDSSAAPTPLGSILQYDDVLQMRRASVIEDLERKGLKPLRTSLPGASPRSAEVENHSARNNESGKGSVGSAQVTRSRSSGEDEGGASLLQRERDRRDRDPRLSKRPRRRISDGTGTKAGPYRMGTLPVGSTPGHGNVRTEAYNRTDASDSRHQNAGIYGSYHDEVGRNNAPSMSEYPIPQFPVSTPGYQYVELPGDYSNGPVMPARYTGGAYPIPPRRSVSNTHTQTPSYNAPAHRSRQKKGRGNLRRGSAHRGRL